MGYWKLSAERTLCERFGADVRGNRGKTGGQGPIECSAAFPADDDNRRGTQGQLVGGTVRCRWPATRRSLFSSPKMGTPKIAIANRFSQLG